MHHENEVVRLCDLALSNTTVKGHSFTNCRLIGPAVIHLVGNVVMDGCNFPQGEAQFWIIDQDFVVGGIALQDTTFTGCGFDGVGIAGPRDLIERFLVDIVASNPPR